MAWTPLSSRVAGLPDVLVGPILRLVKADEVSVFFAFKAPTKVTLQIYAAEANGVGASPQFDGTGHTVPLGPDRPNEAVGVHVVCVTAKGPPALTAGATYSYDVKLGPHSADDAVPATGDGLYGVDVVSGTASAARELLTYPNGPSLPSFVVPPDDVDDLRILHASCRKPHGPGQDAMAIGDTILAQSFPSAAGRPHQLFLGGDQIYADDVAVSLLAMIRDAAEALKLPEERLPTGGGKPGKDFHPGARSDLVRDVAGFTSDDADSHLMTFAEYALMYVFAWSDVLWAGIDPPDFAQALPDEYAEWLKAAADDTLVTKPEAAWMIDKQRDRLLEFKRDLRFARRLLANVPTLMLFDDHEITDDWNLNLDWIRRTQDPAKKGHATVPSDLGRAIIRNGLAAYAIFQAWGNTPEAFVAGTPGRTLLGAIATWDGTLAANEVGVLETCVGLPVSFTDNVANRPAGALTWHFRREWAVHELIALDTRTRRGTVKKEDSDGPPALIYLQADFEAMVPRALPAALELTLVMAPAPVFGVPLHEAAARYLHAPWVKISPGSDPEHWALTPHAREHLLGALLSRPAPGVVDGVRRARVVVLSGDVHHGSAVHVRYSAPTPLGYAGPAEGALAQLTSSALKNEGTLTHVIEAIGFFTFDSEWRPIVGRNMPLIEVSGWANAAGNRFPIGHEVRDELTTGNTAVATSVSISAEGTPALYEFTYGVPFTDPPAMPAEPRYQLTAVPEWRYAVRPARGRLEERQAAGTLESAPGQPATDPVARAVAAAHKHSVYTANLGPGQEVVGHNNIGEVLFDWGAGDDKTVIQRLWWRLGDEGDPKPFSRWELSLANGST